MKKLITLLAVASLLSGPAFAGKSERKLNLNLEQTGSKKNRRDCWGGDKSQRNHSPKDQTRERSNSRNAKK